MKILAIRLLNLNSLQGSHEIDFAKPPLSDCGLFAIIGPTGAGKSTLLDAITLALYGRAARYGSASGPPEFMMTRHTKLCFAELDFEIHDMVYRARWSLQYTKTGKLKSPERKIIRLSDHSILSEKARECDLWIEQETGLNYERFLKSVLLSQGEFAAFLKSDVKDRADLLQQITGTEIYEELSKTCHQWTGEAKVQLEQLRSERNLIPTLSIDARFEIEQALESAQQKLHHELSPKIHALQGRLDSAKQYKHYRNTHRQWHEDHQQYLNDIEAFSEKSDKLERHLKTLSLDPIHNTIGQLKKGIQKTSIEIQNIEIQIPAVSDRLNTLKNALQELQTSIKDHRSSLQSLSEKWAIAESMDQEIARIQSFIQQEITQLNEGESQKNTKYQHLEATTRLHQQHRETFNQLKNWISQHAEDEHLHVPLATLSHVEPEIKNLESQIVSLNHEKKKIAQHIDVSTSKLKQIQELASPLEAHIEAVRNLITDNQSKLASELQEETLESIEAKLNVLNDRLRQLGKAHEIHQKHFKYHAQIEVSRSQKQRLNETYQHLFQQQKHLQNEVLHSAQRVQDLETMLELTRTILSLDVHRQNLKENCPCPLCGSREHPLLEKNPRSYLETEQSTSKDLQIAKDSHQTWLEKERATAIECSQMKTELDRFIEEEKTLKQEISALESELIECGFVPSASTAVILESEISRHHKEVALLSDMKTKVQNLQRELHQAQGHLLDLQEKSRSIQLQTQEFQQSLTEAITKREQLKNIHARVETEISKKKSDIRYLLQEYKIMITWNELHVSEIISQALANLKQRLEAFQNHREALENTKIELSIFEERIKSQQDEIKQINELISTKQTQLKSLKDLLQTKQLERNQCFGNTPVPESRLAYQKTSEALNKQERHLTDRIHKSVLELNQYLERLRHLSQLRDENENQLRKEESNFDQKLKELGFQSHEDYLSSKLPEEDQVNFSAEKNRLDQCLSSLNARAALLEAERHKLSESSERDCLEEQKTIEEIKSLETLRDALHRDIGAHRQKLEDDNQQRAKQAAFLSVIESAEAEYSRREALNQLIGSYDGSAFARFAQSLTLEHLVQLANRQLNLINPRYRLARTPGDKGLNDLGLEIIDLYQANVRRPIKSLSGGETFLTSLALALALSQLAGGAHRIDSLFIDEGFGSLDADSLELAMSALENLQSTGKTIGIISHVEVIKERIPVQIQILKGPSGHSVVRTKPAA